MSYRDLRPGVRFAVTWLHERAKEMNDPNAVAVLNSAAFHLGGEVSRLKPPDGFAALSPQAQKETET